MPFPAEPVPDGLVFAPHHFYHGLYAALLGCAIVWDNQRYSEPVFTVVALGIAYTGFALVWDLYPVTGALMTLIGTIWAGLQVSLGHYWRQLAWRSARGVTLLMILVALDDAISHSFGVWTPLDWLWHAVIHELVVGLGDWIGLVI